MKFTMEQINIGDEVLFENKNISNKDLYWKVVSKHEPDLITVEINEMTPYEKLTIRLNDIKYLIPISQIKSN